LIEQTEKQQDDSTSQASAGGFSKKKGKQGKQGKEKPAK
jgi:hypothetical protein